MQATFKRTNLGCVLGIFTQATVTNITAILFVPMMGLYGFDYKTLGILVAICFITQVAADIIFSNIIDKIGYRKITLPTCAIAAIGLLMFFLAPWLFPNNILIGIIIATVIFAFSSGLLEVIVSPMVAAIPGNDKGPAMAMMHSFYAWGQVITIILTTLYLFIFGSENWQYILLFWMIIPISAFILFLTAPMPKVIPEGKRQGMRSLLFKPSYIIMLVAIFAGASTEIVINQWASTFMEKGLNIPKVWGDLLGMCGFAVMLGVGRVAYGFLGSKIRMSNVTMLGAGVAVFCYLAVALVPFNSVAIIACAVCGLAASLLWPGTIVIASEKYPLAGAWIFAILAAAGDIGASLGTMITGDVIDRVNGTAFIENFAGFLNVTGEQGAIRFGLLIAAIFPLIAFFCHLILHKKRHD